MSLRKASLYILCLTIGFLSCKKDDDGDSPTVLDIRDRAEQQDIDNDSLLGYLEKHYYNSDFINSKGTNVSISDIIISPLLDEETVAPTGHTILREAVGDPKTAVYAETDYEYYVLKLNQGGGTESPSFADSARVNYEGFTLDNVVFDSSVNTQAFDFVGNGVTTFGLIPGWRKVLPQFNVSEDFDENDDGTVDFINHGVGVMFIPSGLGYFSSSPTGIPAYSPLIFKFDLLQMEQNDHDSDGVPSYLEDIDGDGEFTVVGDDTDADNLPDYFDIDDDGDGIPTIDENEQKEYIVNITLEEQEPVLSENEYELNRFTTFDEETNDEILTIKTVVLTDSNNNDIFDFLEQSI